MLQRNRSIYNIGRATEQVSELGHRFRPSTYLSRTLTGSSGHSLCGPGAPSWLSSLQTRGENSLRSAHGTEQQAAPSQSAEPDSGPRHAARATARRRLA